MKIQANNTVRNHICRSHKNNNLYIFIIMHQGGKYKNIPDKLKRLDCKIPQIILYLMHL